MTEKLETLRSLVEFASDKIEKQFRKTGEVHPMYHAIKATGEHMVMLPPGISKDMDVAMMKAAFELESVDRFVFITEAWILDQRKNSGGPPLDLDRINRTGVSAHPDRREVVMIQGENRRGEMILGTRFILRPEIGKPSLAPLVVIDSEFDHSEGRMVGMLQREKK